MLAEAVATPEGRLPVATTYEDAPIKAAGR